MPRGSIGRTRTLSHYRTLSRTKSLPYSKVFLCPAKSTQLRLIGRETYDQWNNHVPFPRYRNHRSRTRRPSLPDSLQTRKWRSCQRSIQSRQAYFQSTPWLFTTSPTRSSKIESEIQRAAKGIKDLNDRVLFAMLEDVEVPDFWMRFQEPTVQLYGDKDRSSTQRLDDLVVRLYWLIYRKTEYGIPDDSGNF